MADLTTRLSLPDPGPSGGEPPPVPGDPFPPVPSGQVHGDLCPSARTAGRNVCLPVADTTCWRDEVWPRDEYADRVEVEIHTSAHAHRRLVVTRVNGARQTR